ncbi:MAG: hypothetical protein U5L04_07595 [Trueperaceae bacterium]|nr:hypothetical protein [Trueperaceae bacterium]
MTKQRRGSSPYRTLILALCLCFGVLLSACEPESDNGQDSDAPAQTEQQQDSRDDDTEEEESEGEEGEGEEGEGEEGEGEEGEGEEGEGEEGEGEGEGDTSQQQPANPFRGAQIAPQSSNAAPHLTASHLATELAAESRVAERFVAWRVFAIG